MQVGRLIFYTLRKRRNGGKCSQNHPLARRPSGGNPNLQTIWVYVALLHWVLWSHNALAFDPDANPSAADSGSLATAAPAPVKNIINDMPVSMFVTSEELARINGAIDAYKVMQENRNNNAENQAKNFLDKLGKPVEEIKLEPLKPVLFTYPQFFLQYLSYQSKNEWVVIINGTKFVPNHHDSNSWLRVVSVSKELVVMEWTPKDMAKVTDVWTIASIVAGQGDVSVDSIGGRVTFTLRSNQTFSSYVMRAVEGKVMPTTALIQPGTASISGAKMNNINAAAAVIPAPVKINHDVNTKEPVAAQGNKQGLSGLSETYKKMGLE